MRDYWAGFRAVSPVMVGVIPFGAIFGATAVEQGFPAWLAGLTSIGVFAGASQIAAVQILSGGGSLLVAVLTAVAINSRFLMYSFALSREFHECPAAKRAGLAYLLTDQAFAVSAARFAQGDFTLAYRVRFYLGAAVGLWVIWQASTWLGIVAGAVIPEAWELDFAIPLAFISLVGPALRETVPRRVFFLSGVLSVLLVILPLQLNILTAAMAGVTLGTIWELRREK